MRISYDVGFVNYDSLCEARKNRSVKVGKILYEQNIYDFILYQVLLDSSLMCNANIIIEEPSPNKILDYLRGRRVDGPEGELTFEVAQESIQKYLKANMPEGGTVACALSGGIDSSTMALFTEPDVLYTAYYRYSNYSEKDFAEAVASKIGKDRWLTFELTENDFLDNWDEYLEAVVVPVGGPGALMEFVALKMLKAACPEVKYVVSGNGGDEVFGGYAANEIVRELRCLSKTDFIMKNFEPQRVAFFDNIINFAIIVAIYRGQDFLNDFLNFRLSPRVSRLLETLGLIDDVISKTLYVNLAITLPTLLHLSRNIHSYLGLWDIHPFTSGDFILRSRSLTNVECGFLPKTRLRNLHPRLPEIVKHRFIKMGFPIPFENWPRVRKELQDLSESFSNRFGNKWGRPQTIRMQWAMANCEKIFKKT